MRRMLLIIASVSGCAADEGGPATFGSLQAQAKSVCEVMADPNAFAGRNIIVRGIYFAEPHQQLIYDADCRQLAFSVEHSIKGEGNRRATAIIEKFRKLNSTVNMPVIYSGTFVARRLTSDCADPSCYSYSLEDARLMAASPRS